MREERKAKSLLDKYRILHNPRGYNEIEETIERPRHPPHQLQLYGIYDEGELIYKEAPRLGADYASARLKIRGLRKYSFHPHSFLRNFFFMNEQQRYLIFFRKFTFCRHKHSCFEHVLRTVYKTLGFYLMLRVAAKVVLKDAVFEAFALWARAVVHDASDKAIQDAALAVEVNAIVGLNLFVLRRCFYSFFLEFLAD